MLKGSWKQQKQGNKKQIKQDDEEATIVEGKDRNR